MLNDNEYVNKNLIGTKSGFDTYESALEDALVLYFENFENINKQEKQENCMMKTFLIAFQENKGYNRYDVGTDDFFEKIREIDSNYFLLFDNVVYIRTEYGAAEIYKRLAPTLGMNYVNAYGLLVQEVNTDVDIDKENDTMCGDQQYDFWKWIKT